MNNPLQALLLHTQQYANAYLQKKIYLVIVIVRPNLNILHGDIEGNVSGCFF